MHPDSDLVIEVAFLLAEFYFQTGQNDPDFGPIGQKTYLVDAP
jgi:hypothetical protein